ncbi:MAG: 4Fe-4S dicluster domain-containing protein [Verrucomicrobiota bacterium]|nr:4Fe-4S dicluster domain-containing protein [Verrucomicrobiota bacterium]
MIDRVPGVARLRRYLRPPGALAEKEFLNACIGCGQCANVCPNKCIQFVSLEKGLDQLATPVIIARSQGCILCMACIHMPQAIRVIPAGQTRRKEPG